MNIFDDVTSTYKNKPGIDQGIPFISWETQEFKNFPYILWTLLVAVT